MLMYGISAFLTTVSLPFPIFLGSRAFHSNFIEVSFASINVPSILSSWVVTSNTRPIFFLYWRGNCKGAEAPAEATSKEKSCSSRSKLCSMLRLTLMQSCKLTP